MGSYVQSVIRAFRALLTPVLLRPGSPYSREDFRADIFAGITVAVIQIPQSMALALIAGLPAIFGLYASLPGVIASLWGSSRQLSTGPVAIVSFLTFTSLAPFAEPRTPEYIGLAAMLAIMIGCMYMLLGVFRFGFIMQLVPHSVISGFSTAAAAIIVLTQLPTLLGLPIASSSLALQNVRNLLMHLPDISYISLAIGATAIALLFAFRRLPKLFPGALIIVTLGIIAGYLVTRTGGTLTLVGTIPAGIPPLILPTFSLETLILLFPKAAIVALVGFVGTHATVKIAAAKTREKVDTNQEFFGQGLANIVTGFFSGFPIAGSFTRTAINVESGTRTAVAAVAGTVVTVLVLVFLTPIFTYLPRSILAAIVIVSAIPLIDIARIRAMAAISHTDGLIAFLTMGLALIFTPDDAIFIGVVGALMVFMWQATSGAKVSEMGVNPEWNVLRGVSIDEKAETIPGTVIARIGMSMFYANSEHLFAQTEQLLAHKESVTGHAVHTLVFDMSGVNFIDISALEIFSDFIDDMKERNVRVGLIYVRYSVRLRLEKMRRSARIVIFHNILELRHMCAPPSDHTLTLGGSRPEFLEATV